MSPTPEELELGAKAYQRVRLHEINTGIKTRRDRWMIAGFGIFMILWAWRENIHFSRHDLIFIWFVPIALWWGWSINRINKESYANQKLILRLLEEKYGDALPWVVEEKQLARARELEAEIAQIQHPVSHAS
jgi:AraC-like DNA-binding protein